MGISGGGEKTRLNAFRLCEMEVPPNGALDMSESLHLIISHLLKCECRGLGVMISQLVG